MNHRPKSNLNLLTLEDRVVPTILTDPTAIPATTISPNQESTVRTFRTNPESESLNPSQSTGQMENELVYVGPTEVAGAQSSMLPPAPPPNNPPVTSDGSTQVTHDRGVFYTPYFYDPDYDTVTVSDYDQGISGSVTYSASTNRFTYTPNPGFVGSDSFTYTVSDGLADATATVDVYVTNQSPLTSDGSTQVTHDRGVFYTPYFYDPDYDTVTVSDYDQGISGSVTYSASTNRFTYTPNPGFVGSDSFTYTVSDGLADATATVDVYVTNQSPLTSDGSTQVTHDRGVFYTPYFYDPDYDTVTVSDYDQGISGSVTYSASTNRFTYTPNPGFVGSDSFTYTVSDGLADATATVDVYVTNQSPLTSDGSTQVTHDRGVFYTPYFYDPDYDTVTVSDYDQGISGSVTYSASTNRFTYTPNPGFVGSDSFTYTVSDGLADATATVDVYVTNQSPLTSDGSTQVTHDRGVFYTPYFYDPDYDTVTVSDYDQGISGSVTYSASTNRFTYTPNPGFVGSDSFTYTVSDGLADATATVDVYVTNQSPLTSDGSTQVTHDRGVFYTPYFYDPDYDTVTVSDYDQGISGSVTYSASTNRFTYTPNPGFVGSDSFTYTVSDGLADATATVDVYVTNQSPLTSDGSTQVTHDRGVFYTPYFYDPDYDTVTVSDYDQGISGSVTYSASTNRFTYTPNPGFVGSDSFTYTVSDGLADATATVDVYVTNQSPLTSDGSTQVTHDRGVFYTPYFYDPDYDTVTVSDYDQGISWLSNILSLDK